MRKAYIVGYLPRGMGRTEPVLSTAYDKIDGVPVASIRAEATRYTNQDHKQTHHLNGLKATWVGDDSALDLALPPPDA